MSCMVESKLKFSDEKIDELTEYGYLIYYYNNIIPSNL